MGINNVTEREDCSCRKGDPVNPKCLCETKPFEPIDLSQRVMCTTAQLETARALIDSLVYQSRDFASAWDDACLHWGRFGEVPARIAILEAAIIEACEIATSPGGASSQDKRDRIKIILAMATQ